MPGDPVNPGSGSNPPKGGSGGTTPTEPTE
jgi:hypothetical protein